MSLGEQGIYQMKIPNPKSQASMKLQIPNSNRAPCAQITHEQVAVLFWSLELGVSLKLGIWGFELSSKAAYFEDEAVFKSARTGCLFVSAEPNPLSAWRGCGNRFGKRSASAAS